METTRLPYTPAALDLLRVADRIAPDMTDDQKDDVSKQIQWGCRADGQDEVQTFHVTEAWTKLGYTAKYGKLIYWQ